MPATVALLLSPALAFGTISAGHPAAAPPSEVADSETPAAAIALLPSGAPDEWNIETRSPSPVTFAASVGEIGEVERIADASRSRWRLSQARRPDWAIVATFTGEGVLLAWRALGRSVARTQDVEAPPGTRVTVSVADRVFEGMAEADGWAHVPIEIPPGVTHARVSAGELTVPHDLGTPPPTAQHEVAAPDRARWLFRVDAQGQPDDSDGAPQGWVRVSKGAFRMMPPQETTPPTAAATSIPDDDRAPKRPSRERHSAPEPRGRVGGRVGAGSYLGPAIRRGAGVSGGATFGTGLVRPGAGAAILFSGLRNRSESGASVIESWALGAVLWGEVALSTRVGPLRAALAPGAGVAWIEHRSARDEEPTTATRERGPVLTSAARVGLWHVDLEARALWSTARLRPETARLGWLLGMVFVWPRDL